MTTILAGNLKAALIIAVGALKKNNMEKSALCAGYQAVIDAIKRGEEIIVKQSQN